MAPSELDYDSTTDKDIKEPDSDASTIDEPEPGLDSV
jgi:hypothetical protein